MILKINDAVAETRETTSPACDMMPGDIIFVSGNTMLSKMIKRSEKSQISHTALAIDPKRIIEAGPFARVEVKPMHYTAYILKRADLTEKQRNAIIQSALTFQGYKFNYAGTFIWYLRLLLKYPKLGITYRPKRLWCSELVDRAYHMAGIDLVPEQAASDVIPPDLLASPLLKEVCRKNLAPDIRTTA